MTKRNLLLVSLLLVFGLAATASSLFAQGTVWSTATNVNTIRNEGDAEAVGTINLTTTSTGTIMNQSGFTITYSLPIAYQKPTYAVGIAVSGPEAGCDFDLAGRHRWHRDLRVNGAPEFYKLQAPWLVSGSNAINIAVRVKAQGYKAGTPVTATVTAFYTFSAATLTISSTSNTTLLVANVAGPATAVTLTEGPAEVLTCIGVKDIGPYDNDFSLRLTENWVDALTSLSDEYNLEERSVLPGRRPSPWYPTNGSNILITLSGIPDLIGIVPRTPIPCNNTDSSSSNYCAGGNLVIEDGIPQATNAPYGSHAKLLVLD